MSAVATGQLDSSGCDTLLVGTPTNFLAYDVENNSDLFYKDVSGFCQLKAGHTRATRIWGCHTMQFVAHNAA